MAIRWLREGVMTRNAIASTDLLEALRPQTRGEPVNVHVVPAVKEPEPDFDEMQRIIQGPQEVSDDEHKRAVKPEDR